MCSVLNSRIAKEILSPIGLLLRHLQVQAPGVAFGVAKEDLALNLQDAPHNTQIPCIRCKTGCLTGSLFSTALLEM